MRAEIKICSSSLVEPGPPEVNNPGPHQQPFTPSVVKISGELEDRIDELEAENKALEDQIDSLQERLDSINEISGEEEEDEEGEDLQERLA